MDPRAGSGHDFAGFWRVGSALRGIFSFSLNISGFLNQCESSNTALRLVGFQRYLIYIIIKQLKNKYLIKLNIHTGSDWPGGLPGDSRWAGGPGWYVGRLADG